MQDRTLDKQPDAATKRWASGSVNRRPDPRPDAGGNRPDAGQQCPIDYSKVSERQICDRTLANVSQQAFDELNASHERLQEAHEKLGKAHKKLEKAHSSLLNEQNEKKHIETCDVGLTCDIIDESLSMPIIVAPTNPSCSTSTSTLSNSDGFTCNGSQMVENETLKKKVNELTHTLAKAYGDEDRLLICLGSQRASLYKEGLDYTPRKARRSLLLTRLVL